jgi:hypothetical protein
MTDRNEAIRKATAQFPRLPVYIREDGNLVLRLAQSG